MTTANAPPLYRVLTFWDVFFIAVGQIIGAGVIALTGVAIGMTGPGVVLAYVAAAVLVILSSILVLVAGASLPATGAFYAWTSRLLGGWAGCTTVLLILLASISLSLYGSAIGLYLEPLFPVLSVNGWGIVVILALFVANLFGVKLAARIQSVLVLVMLSALALYAGFAMPQVDPANLSPMLPNGMLGFLTAVFLVKFATGGASLVVGLGGEIRNPARTLPLVVVTATMAVAVIYALIALASVGVVPWEQMINEPLTVAGRAFLPGWAFAYFVTAGAGLAVCTTLNAQFMHLPRNFIVASWDHLLPAWVGSVNRFGTPWLLLSVMVLIGIVPLAVGLDIGVIARLTSVAASLPAVIVYWAILKIPQHYPDHYRASVLAPRKAWLWFWFTWAQLSTLIGVVLLARDLSATLWLTLLAWLVAALAYYPARRWFLRRSGIALDETTTDRAVFGSPGAHAQPNGN